MCIRDRPMAEASMLQVIVVALLFGFGTIVAGKKGEVFGNFVESANDVSIAVMSFIIKLSPIGVFCLITPVVAANGPQILGSLAFVLLVAYIGYILHASLVYSLTVKSLAGIGPLKFFKGMAPALSLIHISLRGRLGIRPAEMCLYPSGRDAYQLL